jgi:hypothetical protein
MEVTIMPRWKCGKCGTEYEPAEWFKLRRAPLNPSDVSPAMQSGNVPQCRCGYVFHRDKWQLKDTLTISLPSGDTEVTVSTVFTEFAWDDEVGEPFWFETVILPAQPIVECSQCWRYRTKEEAEKGHQKIVEALRAGNFKAASLKWRLVVLADD